MKVISFQIRRQQKQKNSKHLISASIISFIRELHGLNELYSPNWVNKNLRKLA